MKTSKYISKRDEFNPAWKGQTLEMLEKDNWGQIPKDESYLVTTCHELRRKPLADFEIEDYRILIGQNISLKYVIPLALKILEENILAEGDFYEGDLLKAVLTSDIDYWKIEREDWQKVISMFHKNIERINAEAETYDTGREILKAFYEFEKIK